jgi:hypothetical protein
VGNSSEEKFADLGVAKIAELQGAQARVQHARTLIRQQRR